MADVIVIVLCMLRVMIVPAFVIFCCGAYFQYIDNIEDLFDANISHYIANRQINHDDVRFIIDRTIDVDRRRYIALVLLIAALVVFVIVMFWI